MATRKTVARWFTDLPCTPANFAQPQTMSSGSASCPQQTRIWSVCASHCYLTDGLGSDRIAEIPRGTGGGLNGIQSGSNNENWTYCRTVSDTPVLSNLPNSCEGLSDG